MELRNIAIHDIDTGESLFDLYRRQAGKALTESVRRKGVLDPLHGIAEGNRIQLLAGFRRMRAAVATMRETVPVIVCGEEMSGEEQCELSLHLAQEGGQLPVMAMARLARLAEAKLEDPLGWLCRQARYGQFGMNRDRYDQLRMILTAPEAFRAYFEEYDAPLNTVVSIMRIPEAYQETILEWARGLRVRPVELAGIVSDLIDCARIGEMSIGELMRIVMPEKAEEIDRKKRGEYIERCKRTLSRLRNPELHEIRAECGAATDKLKELCGAEITYDPGFETAGITITFKVANLEEITTVFSLIESEQAQESLEHLFSYVQ